MLLMKLAHTFRCTVYHYTRLSIGGEGAHNEMRGWQLFQKDAILFIGKRTAA